MTESPPASQAPLMPRLIMLPGGPFLMGNDGGRQDERPVHEVQLSPFQVAQEPVSNAEYARYVRARCASAPEWWMTEAFNDPHQPVVGVNWFEASDYCQWLADEAGIPFRLPTEAEREFAALGGNPGAEWPWIGLEHPIAGTITAQGAPHVPWAECANGYGLRCMAENVHEWCSDWYDAGYYAKSPAVSPAGPTNGVRRASRGGAWRHSVKFTRVAARSSLPPEYRYSDYGFRVYADA